MTRTRALLALACVALVSASASAQGPWVPHQSESSLTLIYTFQAYSDFYRIDEERSYPFGDNHQHTVFGIFEYGLTDRVAIDVTVAYTHTSTSTSPADPTTGAVDNGLADSAFGFRWRVIDEFESSKAPTLTLRFGGIVAGTYDAGLPYSAGDGASGVEAALMLGKDLGGSGFGLYGESGYRHRAERVPADFFAQVGVYKSMGDWSTDVGVRHVHALSGVNLGDPNFSFQELQEIATYLEASIGHTGATGRYIGAHFAQTLDGRNTAKKTVFGLSVTFPF